VFLDRLQN
jgi:serine/threonine protein kinase